RYGMRVISWPNTRTEPRSGTRSRRISLRIVDLPVPDSPSTSSVSPSHTYMSTPRSTGSSKLSHTSRSSITLRPARTPRPRRAERPRRPGGSWPWLSAPPTARPAPGGVRGWTRSWDGREQHQQELGHEVIQREDQHRGGDHGTRRRTPDALRAALGSEAVITPRDCDHAP